MKQTLTTEDVDSIIGAIEIAEDESGGDYSDLKTKLLTIYPETKDLIDERNRKWQEESDTQRLARERITRIIFHALKKGEPIISQLQYMIGGTKTYNMIRKNYSDEICLSADLFKYHLEDLIELGLIAELRDYIKQESKEDGNEWMKDHYKDKADDQLWHVLVKILDRVKRS